MQLPSYIWQLKGKHSGPNVTVLGGTHGNEESGIFVVRKILSSVHLLQSQAGSYPINAVNGNLFIGFGNPEAIVRGMRGASKKRDLNRSFITEELKAPPSADDWIDLRRARELMPLFDNTNYLFDIHGTSSPSEPFVCFGNDSARHRRFYRLIPTRSVLTDPHRVLGRDMGLTELGTTDSYVNNIGNIALCYESGQAADASQITQTLRVVLRLLIETGVVNEDFPGCAGIFSDIRENERQEVYALSHCECAKNERFIYDHGMNRSWQMVQKGMKLGSYANGEDVLFPDDGMLLFPKAADQVTKGQSLYYMAVHIDEP